MSDQTIRITTNHILTGLDLTKLAQFLTEVVQPFFGDEAKFSGTHEWNDKVTRHKNFTEIESWSKTSGVVLDEVNATISSKDYVRDFAINWYRRPESRVHLSANILESEQDSALVLFETFESKFKAPEPEKTIPVPRPIPPRDIRFNRRYLLTATPAVPWLQKIVDTIGPLRAEQQTPRGDLRFRKGLFRNFETTEALFESFAADPDDVADVTLRFRFPESEVRAVCYLDREEFEVDVSSSSEDDATLLISEIDSALGLKRIEGMVQLEGLKKRGFGKRKFDLAWFEDSIRHLQSEFPRAQYVSAEISRSEGDTSPRKFNNIDAWMSAVAADWGKIDRTFLSVQGPHRIARLTCFHREEEVIVEVEAATKQDAETLLDRLNKKFEIEFTEEEPYRQANSSSTFAIRAWQNRTFAELVRDAADVAIGPKRWVRDAWIREEGETGQPLHSAKSLEEFVKLIESDKKYVETDLRVIGPRGRVLRIRVYENRSRIDFRSTLSQTELNNVVESFQKSLRLKTIKEIESQEASDSPPKKETSLWVKIIAVVGTGLVGLILSVAFIKALVPQDSVTITSPRAAKEAGEVAGSDFRVEWRVQREQYFRRIDLPSPHGNIRVVQGKNAWDYLDRAPGDQVLSLSPGAYVLTVSIPSLNTSDTVYFTVTQTAPAPEPTRATTPTRRPR